MIPPSLFEELKQHRNRIFGESSSSELLAVLRSFFPDLSDKLFVIGSIPEPGAELVTLLIDGNKVVDVEMSTEPFVSHPVSFDVMDLNVYLQAHPELPKTTRRKIEAAIKLSED